jgi:hypothetical protein
MWSAKLHGKKAGGTTRFTSHPLFFVRQGPQLKPEPRSRTTTAILSWLPALLRSSSIGAIKEVFGAAEPALNPASPDGRTDPGLSIHSLIA